MLKRTLLATALTVALVAPTQAAEIPQSATLKYGGTMGIPATMNFKRNGDNYTVTANINVPMYKIRFESGGKIVGNQLKPTYYTDTRNGKLYASAKFSGSRVNYGKVDDIRSPYTATVSGSVMDLFTLSWQLAFNDGNLPANTYTTNGKSITKLGALRATGSKAMTVAGKKITVQQFSISRDEGNVTYAFAPALQNMPAQISYSDDGKKYNLTLKSVVINGEVIKPN